MNLKLGTKIAGGFAILLLIAMLLGGLAIYKMSDVEEKATILAKEYVPEVKVANDLRGAANRVMYEMRGYGFTENKAFKDQADVEIKAVEEHIAQGKDLAQKAKHLVKLSGQIKASEDALNEYKTLVKQTSETTAALAENRANLDSNAGIFIKVTADYLAEQNQKLDRDVKERQSKINLVIDIVNLGTKARVLNFKSQATGKNELMQESVATLEDVFKKTAELRKITRLDFNIKQIESIEKAATGYKNAMASYLEEHKKGKAADQAKLQESRNQMDANAGTYAKNSNDFLESQNIALEKDISSRVTKINLANDVIDLGNAARIATFKAQAVRDPSFIEQAFKEYFPVIDEKYDALKKMTTKEVDLQRIDTLKGTTDGYKNAMSAFLGNWKTLQALGTKRGETGTKMIEACKTTATAGMDGTVRSADESVTALESASSIMSFGLLIALIVGVALAYIITVGITKPINRIIASLSDSGAQTSSASNQISASSQQLAEGATEQAASLEETSSALEEMASMTRQNAENSVSANNMMNSTRSQVQKGADDVRSMAAAMGEIKDSSDQIGNIIKTIEEIAFQTNLLALNAAVEAARAGDAGKGFAVVADEVRNLAQRAGQAARDTAELIEGTVVRVKAGSEIVTTLESSFAEIEESANKVAKLVEGISAASNEQAQGVDQVNTAVAQMDKVTQQNAANAEESASASEELSSQAENLNVMVVELATLVGGSQNGHNGNGRSRQKALGMAPKPRALPSPVEARSKNMMVVKPNDVIPMEEESFNEF